MSRVNRGLGKWLFYILGGTCFLALKWWYRDATVLDLKFLLSPTNIGVELLSGSPSTWTVEGFFFPELNILIEKSCSGFNFALLLFAMLFFLSINRLDNLRRKIYRLPILLITSYFLTIIANTSRIYLALFMGPGLESLGLASGNVHDALGVCSNFIFLIIIYLLAERFLQSKLIHEKPASSQMAAPIQ